MSTMRLLAMTKAIAADDEELEQPCVVCFELNEVECPRCGC